MISTKFTIDSIGLGALRKAPWSVSNRHPLLLWGLVPAQAGELGAGEQALSIPVAQPASSRPGRVGGRSGR